MIWRAAHSTPSLTVSRSARKQQDVDEVCFWCRRYKRPPAIPLFEIFPSSLHLHTDSNFCYTNKHTNEFRLPANTYTYTTPPTTTTTPTHLTLPYLTHTTRHQQVSTLTHMALTSTPPKHHRALLICLIDMPAVTRTPEYSLYRPSNTNTATASRPTKSSRTSCCTATTASRPRNA